MKTRTPKEITNEQTIRKLYLLADAATKDTAAFVSMFDDGGYFYDVAAQKKYGSSGNRVGDFGSISKFREHASEDLEPQILFVA